MTKVYESPLFNEWYDRNGETKYPWEILNENPFLVAKILSEAKE